MKTTRTLSAVLGLAVAGIALVGCGSAPADPAAVKACQMVESANNDYQSALYEFNNDQTEINRSNAKFYLDLRPSQLQDAYETAPLTMRADIKNLAEMAELIKRIPGDRTGAAAYNLTIADIWQSCIAAGVPVQQFNWDNGQVEDVQPQET